ncbi:S1 family peptidase [Streptomyces sp. NPDC052396]|uniref:S1 family peptidase n=1 Tax=Streptomyces sp. NPDC052396 TaxID=3365689 RepID=UPI0037D3F760
MTAARKSRRRSAIAGVGAVVLAATTLGVQSAGAHPEPSPAAMTSAQAGQLAQKIQHGLGPDTAGSYYDAKHKKLVVNVLDRATAAKVRAAGAEPRIVRHSTAQLTSARKTLAAKATIPGTAWSVDPRSNKVIVTADRTVNGAKLAKLGRTIAALGDRVTLKRTSNTLRPFIAGGDAIWAPTARCSLGFNVTTSGGQAAFLTAGHCGNISDTWSDSQGGGEIGHTTTSTFPGHDYALVTYTSGIDHPSAVDLYNGSQQNISHAANATVGEQVQRSGSTTQVQSGQVTGLDATVNYQEGTVNGLIDTSVCAEPGDSGGALFDNDAALGLTSGGSGDCSSGGETFFQPVPDALSAVGANIP